jgi:hypothetical protein
LIACLLYRLDRLDGRKTLLAFKEVRLEVSRFIARERTSQVLFYDFRVAALLAVHGLLP